MDVINIRQSLPPILEADEDESERSSSPEPGIRWSAAPNRNRAHINLNTPPSLSLQLPIPTFETKKDNFVRSADNQSPKTIKKRGNHSKEERKVKKTKFMEFQEESRNQESIPLNEMLKESDEIVLISSNVTDKSNSGTITDTKMDDEPAGSNTDARLIKKCNDTVLPIIEQEHRVMNDKSHPKKTPQAVQNIESSDEIVLLPVRGSVERDVLRPRCDDNHPEKEFLTLKRRNKRMNDQKPASNSIPPPSVPKAMEILQWAWNEEKLAINTSCSRNLRAMHQSVLLAQQEASSLQDEAEILKDQNKSHKDNVIKIKSKFVTLTGAHKTLKLAFQGLGRDIGKARKDYIESKDIIFELKIEYDAVKTQLHGSHGEVESLYEQIKKLKLDHQLIGDKWNHETRSLIRMFSELKLELQTKNHEILLDNERIRNLKKLLEKQNDHQKILEEKLRELENYVMTEVISLFKENTGSKEIDATEELKQMMRDMKVSQNLLPCRVGDLDLSLQEVMKRFDQTTLDNINSKKVAESEALTSESARRDDLNSIISHIDSLKMEFSSLHSFQEQVLVSKSENSNLQRQNDNLEQIIQRNEHELKEFKIKVQENEKCNLQKESELTKLKSEIANLQSSLSKLELSLQEADDFKDASKDQQESLNITLKNLQKDISQMHDEKLKILSQHENELHEEKVRIEKEASQRLNEHSLKLQRQIQELEFEIYQTKETLQKAKDDKSQEIDSMKHDHDTALIDIQRKHEDEVENLKETHTTNMLTAQQNATALLQNTIQLSLQSQQEAFNQEKQQATQQQQLEANKVKQLQDTIEVMRQQHEIAMQTNEQTWKDRLFELQTQLSSQYNEKVVKLHDDFESLQRENTACKQVLEHQYEGELHAAKSTIDQLQKEICDLKIQIQSLQYKTGLQPSSAYESLRETFLPLPQPADKSKSQIYVRKRLSDVSCDLNLSQNVSFPARIATPMSSLFAVPESPEVSSKLLDETILESQDKEDSSSEFGIVRQACEIDPFNGEQVNLLKNNHEKKRFNSDAIPFSLDSSSTVNPVILSSDPTSSFEETTDNDSILAGKPRNQERACVNSTPPKLTQISIDASQRTGVLVNRGIKRSRLPTNGYASAGLPSSSQGINSGQQSRRGRGRGVMQRSEVFMLRFQQELNPH